MQFSDSSVGKESICNEGNHGSIPASRISAGEGIGYPLQYLGLLLWLSWWRISLKCWWLGFDPWVGKTPWRRGRLTTPVRPGEFHGLCTHGVTKSQTWLSDFHFFNSSDILKLNNEWMGFPGGTSGKEPVCKCRKSKRLGFDPWVQKIPWRSAWQPTSVFLPGESYGQRSLVGYSP